MKEPEKEGVGAKEGGQGVLLGCRSLEELEDCRRSFKIIESMDALVMVQSNL